VANRIFRARGPVFLLLLTLVLVSSCRRTHPPATKRYPFTGRIISIDAQNGSANIDGDMIQGFMEAMQMAYKIKPASLLARLSPGDVISAEVVVVDHDPRDENADSDYWLENVKVTGHVPEPPAGPAKAVDQPSPGEDVPDFSFLNQDGKRISVAQYRGKVLLVTFIYTRCPFPDFCPRLSRNFAEIYKQLGSNPALRSTHLLSISFDPQHDTSKVLRDYGFSVAHVHDAALFRRWQFASARAGDLPQIADFFALTIQPDQGLITHNLSTAVIGPDGKIVSWYHGGDWQVADLVRDAGRAQAAEGAGRSQSSRARGLVPGVVFTKENS
jgi:protein SCO1